MLPISVLMAVYYRDDPAHLHDAINSILNQIELPSELIIVADGPLTVPLDECLNKAQNSTTIPIKILRKCANEGLALALQDGLTMAAHDIVARMDSDDISDPQRLSHQYAYLVEHPTLDILSSWQPEFSESPVIIDRVKTAPETHDAIVRQLWWRNVISHPAVMFRRNRVTAIGGYRNIPLLEDYDLWLRAIVSGLRFGCMQEPLLYMRVLPAQRIRRGGKKYAAINFRWRLQMLREGYYSWAQFLLLAPLYFIFHISSPNLKTAFYALVRNHGQPSSAARTTISNTIEP